MGLNSLAGTDPPGGPRACAANAGLVGLGVMTIAPWRMWINGEPFANDMIFMLLFGMIFAGVAAFLGKPLWDATDPA